jgi:hypothetical protein
MKAGGFGLLGLAACGRVSFGLIGDAGSTGVGDGRSDVRMSDAPIDVPPNAITRTFGERLSADFKNVTSDTFISNEAGEPTLNYGATDELRSEQDVNERILLRFSLAAIPTTATVFQVFLAIEVTEANPNANWQLHPLLEAWAEGTGDGVTGAANYTQRAAALTWTTLGAGTPGSAGALFVATQPSALGPLVIGLPVQSVQNWVANPAANFGMVFVNDHTDTARMASRESAIDAARPLLTVTYVP